MHIGVIEVLGGALLFFVVMISRSAELLGAELVLPVVTVAFDFRQRESVELAAPAILIGVFIKFGAAFFKKNKKYKSRKVIDFRFAAVIMPLVLIGTTWGWIVHRTIAKILESVLLALAITYLLFKSVVHAIKEWRLHKLQMRRVMHLNELEASSSNLSSKLSEDFPSMK